jgi:hypothetical protein
MFAEHTQNYRASGFSRPHCGFFPVPIVLYEAVRSDLQYSFLAVPWSKLFIHLFVAI